MKAKDKQRLYEIKVELGAIIEGQKGHSDQESDHSESDDLLCEALKIYGENEMVSLYDKISKWYA